MGSLGWAVGLSMLSAASYAAAAVAQERLAENSHRGWSRWATALLLTAGGVALHVLALNFGTVAVVQALGTLTLLFALPISALRYHQRISTASWVDAALTVAGLALIMSLSVDSGRPAVLTAADGRYLSLVTLVAAVVLGGGAWFSRPRMRAVLLAGAAGVVFGIASVLTKAVMASFTSSGASAISPYLTTMVVIFSISGYLLGQLSYKGAGLAAPLATVSVTNPVAAAIAGVIVFDEGFRFGRAGLAVVAVAAVVITLGVIGLSRQTVVAGTTTDPEDPPAAYALAEHLEAETAAAARTHHNPDPDAESEPSPH
jgi:drug/metabolite transporter (DMT)-like permease